MIAFKTQDGYKPSKLYEKQLLGSLPPPTPEQVNQHAAKAGLNPTEKVAAFDS